MVNIEKIKLSNKEKIIFDMLSKNPGQIIKKTFILQKVWGLNCQPNYAEVYISSLRKKLKIAKSDYEIKTIRGVGYKLTTSNKAVVK